MTLLDNQKKTKKTGVDIQTCRSTTITKKENRHNAHTHKRKQTKA